MVEKSDESSSKNGRKWWESDTFLDRLGKWLKWAGILIGVALAIPILSIIMNHFDARDATARLEKELAALESERTALVEERRKLESARNGYRAGGETRAEGPNARTDRDTLLIVKTVLSNIEKCGKQSGSGISDVLSHALDALTKLGLLTGEASKDLLSELKSAAIEVGKEATKATVLALIDTYLKKHEPESKQPGGSTVNVGEKIEINVNCSAKRTGSTPSQPNRCKCASPAPQCCCGRATQPASSVPSNASDHQ